MLQLDAATLAARLDRRALIDALDEAFRKPCEAPLRHRHELPPAGVRAGGTLLMMPAWTAEAFGVKLVSVFPGNTELGFPSVSASYLLFDGATGRPRALLDGEELTLRRTGAASALASRYLSAAGAARMTMVGTGALAPHLIESHALVRPIREVRIWGRRAERARARAAALAAGHPDWLIEGTEDLEGAVRWADLVSCATLSREPLVRGAWLRPGQHLDLVGSFSREMREADDEAVARAELYVDTRAGALSESGEILGAIERAIIDRGAIRAELGELSGGRFRRSNPDAITLFKSVGTALEDLTAALLATTATGGSPA